MAYGGKMLDRKIINYKELIDKSTKGFVGRGWVRDAVDVFLSGKEPRHFLLVGEPGSGKTAFMADLVRRRGYPHHFIGKGSQISVTASLDWRNPVRFAESIGYQLVRDYGGWTMNWDDWGINVSQEVKDLKGLLVGAEVEQFQASPRPAGKPKLSLEQEVEQFGPAARIIGIFIDKFVMDVEQIIQQLLTTPLRTIAERWPERQLVLVIDGLDEAENYSNPRHNILKLLPNGSLPANVRFLLSSRPGQHLRSDFLSQVQPFWLSEDEQGQRDPHTLKDAHSYAMKLTEEEAIGQMLSLRNIKPEVFSEQVANASRGNFLYLHHYAQGVREGDDTLLNLAALPKGLYGIYQDFLGKIKEKREDVSWDNAYKPVLGVLAAAQELQTRNQIANFSGVSRGTVGTVLVQVKQFLDVIGTDGNQYYAIYHTSFGEYLISEENEDYIDGQEIHGLIAERYLSAWGGLASGLPALTNADQQSLDNGYGLRHLATHLHAAGQIERLNQLLTDFDWLSAKLEQIDSAALLTDYVLADDTEVNLVRDALRLSSYALTVDKAQLAGQIVGRLAFSGKPALASLVQRARAWAARPWLCPLTSSLTTPGGPLVRILKGRAGGHAGTVRSLAITPDGRQAITAGNSSNDQTVRIWDLDSGMCLHTLEQQAATGYTPLALDHTGKHAFTAFEDEVRAWQVVTGLQHSALAGDGDWITALATTADGERVIIGTVGGMVRVWDVTLESFNLASHDEQVLAVAVSNDGRWAASISASLVKVWELTTRQERQTLRTSTGLQGNWSDAYLLWIAADGGQVLFGDPPKSWNIESGIVTDLMDQPPPLVEFLAIAPNGQRALVKPQVNDMVLEVWDMLRGEKLLELEHSGYVATAALTFDGQCAFSADFEHDLFVWNLLDEVLIRTQMTSGAMMQFEGFIPDGNAALFRLPNGQQEVYSLESSDLVPIPGPHNELIQEMSAKARRQATIREEVARKLKLRDDAQFGHLLVISGDGRRAVSAFYFGGKAGDYEEPEKAAVINQYDEVTLWDLEDEQHLFTKPVSTSLHGHSAPVLALDMTPDGRIAISAGWGRIVRVWDLEAKSERWALRGHTGLVSAVAITPDATRAASASEDGTLRLWDLENGQLLARV
jgi:WD40 repeat protein